LLAGVFAAAAVSVGPDTPNGLPGLLEGNPHQVVVQLYGIGATIVWAGIGTFVLLKIVDALVGLRVSDETERSGLDVNLHGESIHS